MQQWLKKTIEDMIRLPYNDPVWNLEGNSIDPVPTFKLLLYLIEWLPNDCPAPWIVPDFDGGVGAAWDKNGVELDFNCEPGKEVTYYISHHEFEDNEEIMEDYELTNYSFNMRIKDIFQYCIMADGWIDKKDFIKIAKI